MHMGTFLKRQGAWSLGMTGYDMGTVFIDSATMLTWLSSNSAPEMRLYISNLASLGGTQHDHPLV